ncbi:competence protein CoiA [Paucisalibacillus globulus]|uniref:competence protein CoiA n=1 Tax=Paucisalibacillus globulus TaxID=351095 RepID=UPI00042311F3|nr:competence protein CoiA family protein [Paucisalibacillus globulus]
MLQAKLNNGKLITLFQYSKMEIEKLRANQQFFCPTCNEKVIIKAGSKTIAHFAHRSITDCQSSDGGEGVYHEQGKLLLYRWLQAQGLNASLEEYIPSIKQRPDIFLRIGKKKIAIEYQCARIPTVNVQSRTKGYLSGGIQPLWILGANLFQRIGRNLLKVDHFTLQFLQQYSRDYLPVMYFFDPHSNIFLTASNLYQTDKNRMIGILNMEKLKQIHFKNIFKISRIQPNLLINEWKKAKYKFRIYHPKRIYGKEQLWYKWLYYKGTHREQLPSIIYLPVPSQYRMVTPPWDWQSRICLGIIDPLPLEGAFSLSTCRYQLQRSISTESLPLIKSPGDPILEYLMILCSLNLIQQLSKYQFVKKREIIHYTHMEDALIGDNKLMDEILKNFKTKYEHDSHLIRYTKY